MNEAVGAGQDLDKGAELDDLAHRAFVYFPDLRFGGDPLHHFDGFLRGGLVAGSDDDRAVVFHVHLDAGGLDDAANDFSPGSDDLADLVRLDFDRDDARRVARDVFAVRRDGLVHDAEDVHPAFPRLVQGLAHDIAVDAADLDVHLQRGDPAGGTGDLEIHVAQVILVAEDVGENSHMLPFFDQPHGDARHRRRYRYAGVHQRERPAAHRRHRRRAVGFHYLPHHTYCV